MSPLEHNMQVGARGVDWLSQLERVDQPDQAAKDDMSFKDVLNGLVDKVDSLQKDADKSIKGLVTGETTDIHTVAVKMREAGVAFDLMMEVRNKLMTAYKEISKMQP